jgi:tyrosyl-tRNA synthetase
MKINTDPKKIEEILSRGVDEVIGEKELREKLISGKQLRVKLGIDPTSPNLHLGRSIPLLKLRDFQEMGHKVVLIVGDFTGTIGDTSDKDSERPMLTKKQVEENLKNYKKQISKVIDVRKAEIHFNSKWLKKLNFAQIGELAQIFSINQFISRDNIAKRLQEGKRVSLHETLYPLMQGFDSVAVKADVELGGTDQRFNTLAGRDIQKHFKQEEQSIVISPLIEGLDGRKMSSSWGNTINFMDSPEEMYGKIMSMNDEFILKYFELLTRVSNSEIEEVKEKVSSDPKGMKMRLAESLVAIYHSEDKAEDAQSGWKKTFEIGEIPDNAKKIKVNFKKPLVDILLEEGLVKSKTEYNRLVKDGALKITVKQEERKIVDPNSFAEESGALKIGKKRFLKIEVTKD